MDHSVCLNYKQMSATVIVNTVYFDCNIDVLLLCTYGGQKSKLQSFRHNWIKY